MSLHDHVINASEGQLPPWAVAGASRVAHMRRVSQLMDEWSTTLGSTDDERRRWRSLGLLHDALREANPEDLRARVPPPMSEFPGPVLHGPAAAERLRVEGVDDGPLLTAVTYHTIGSPALDLMGRALYAADFLEPGRPFLPEWREALRARMPEELDDVVMEILGARIKRLIDREVGVLPETVAFWNQLTTERGEG